MEQRKPSVARNHVLAVKDKFGSLLLQGQLIFPNSMSLVVEKGLSPMRHAVESALLQLLMNMGEIWVKNWKMHTSEKVLNNSCVDTQARTNWKNLSSERRGEEMLFSQISAMPSGQM